MLADARALGEAVDTRPIGGLGALLVGQFVGDVGYAYEDGGKRL